MQGFFNKGENVMTTGEQYYNKVMGDEERHRMETRHRNPFYKPAYGERLDEGFDMTHKNDMEK